MSDIEIDRNQLSRFIDTLAGFQRVVIDDWALVETAVGNATESWKGMAWEQFHREYTEMKTDVDAAIGSINDAYKWLLDFDAIIRDIEDSRL